VGVTLPKVSDRGVVLFHVAALWALQSGLLRRAAEVVIPVSILSEFVEPPKPVEPPPPPPPPPPEPKRQITKTPPPPRPQAIREPKPTPAPNAPTGSVEPPPPPVNLQGFPPSYRLGFGDGCATGRGGPEKKDPVRYGNDGNYRVGWQDGLAQCKKK